MGKLNTNSNGYIIAYSAILVLIVAFLLAFVYQALKPLSDANVEIDKKSQILAALNIRDLNNDAVVSKYNEVVESDQVIDASANVLKSNGGFNTAASNDSLPLYVCNVNGEKKYVLPLKGKGLWGPIWGYLAINADKQTVYGAYFNHESETAGLGARIVEYEAFQKQFAGKKLSKDNAVLSVVKFQTVKDPEIECDGISGATKTGNGVSDMIKDGLSSYSAFLKK